MNHLMELEHKVKLSAILALVLNNIRRENIRKANTLSKLETLGNKSHLQHRLESISCKSAGLNARKELIEHLLASPLVQEENGDISCECCRRTFKYHPAKKGLTAYKKGNLGSLFLHVSKIKR